MNTTQRDVVTRLSKYRSVLYKLKSLGFVRVFSDNLADAISITPTLVRKDFSLFGLTGHRRGGYRIDELIARLNAILGKDREQRIVIVGCGKIGQALMNYGGFAREGIRVVAGFDSNPEKQHSEGAIPVLPMEKLAEVTEREQVSVAIVTVPEPVAAHVMERLSEAGIEGILNFAPVTLKGSHGCIVQNINIALEIENLFYFVRAAHEDFGDLRHEA